MHEPYSGRSRQSIGAPSTNCADNVGAQSSKAPLEKERLRRSSGVRHIDYVVVCRAEQLTFSCELVDLEGPSKAKHPPHRCDRPTRPGSRVGLWL